MMSNTLMKTGYKKIGFNQLTISSGRTSQHCDGVRFVYKLCMLKHSFHLFFEGTCTVFKYFPIAMSSSSCSGILILEEYFKMLNCHFLYVITSTFNIKGLLNLNIMLIYSNLLQFVHSQMCPHLNI